MLIRLTFERVGENKRCGYAVAFGTAGRGQCPQPGYGTPPSPSERAGKRFLFKNPILHVRTRKSCFMSKNLSELSGRKGLRENLFEELGIAATHTGAVSKDQASALADEFLFGKANVYGAATFYDFLRPENQGKKVYMCNGSACLTAGTQPALREKLAGSFAEEEIGEMCCLGRCHENSSFYYAGRNYSGGDIDKIVDIRGGASLPMDKYNVQAY